MATVINAKCRFCGERFPAQRSTAKFCSDNCRVRAHYARRRKPVERQDARRQREAEVKVRRSELEALAIASGLSCDIAVADVRTWRPAEVDCVISDPPYIVDDALDLYSALADFALDVLPDGGALVAMTDVARLPGVLRVMQRDGLVYRGTIAWTFGTNPRGRDWKRKTFPCWKPVVVYHKHHWNDAAWTRMEIVSKFSNVGDWHRWEQDAEGFAQLVERFSKPGDVVCDPFLGSGTTAVAALAQLRRFTGCDIDPAAVAVAEKRLSLEQARRTA